MAGIIVQKAFIIANLTQNNSHTSRRRVWRVSPNGHQKPADSSNKSSNRTDNLGCIPAIYWQDSQISGFSNPHDNTAQDNTSSASSHSISSSGITIPP